MNNDNTGIEFNNQQVLNLDSIKVEDLEALFYLYSSISNFCNISINILNYIQDVALPIYNNLILSRKIQKSINKRNILIELKHKDFINEAKSIQKEINDDFELNIKPVILKIVNGLEKLPNETFQGLGQEFIKKRESPSIEIENVMPSDLNKAPLIPEESEISESLEPDEPPEESRGVGESASINSTEMFWVGISMLKNDLQEINQRNQSLSADVTEAEANEKHAAIANSMASNFSKMSASHNGVANGLGISIAGLTAEIGGTAAAIAGLCIAGASWPLILPGTAASAAGLGAAIAGISTQIAGASIELSNESKLASISSALSANETDSKNVYSGPEAEKDSKRISRDVGEITYWNKKLGEDLEFIAFVLATPRVPILPIWPWEELNQKTKFVPDSSNPSEIAEAWIEGAATTVSEIPAEGIGAMMLNMFEITVEPEIPEPPEEAVDIVTATL